MSRPRSARFLKELIDSLGRRFLGFAVGHHLHALHEPFAPHLANEWIGLPQAIQPGAQTIPQHRAAAGRRFVLHHFDRGQRRGCRHWIAAKSADGEAGALHCLSDLAARDAVGEREAIGDALGHGHDVGLDVPVLDAEPVAARTPKAGLYLVDDHQTAMIAGNFSCDCEVFGRRRDKAPHALDRLHEDGRNLTAGLGLDDVLHILGASHAAARVFKLERAAVAIGIVRVLDVRAKGGPHAPGRLRRQAHGKLGLAAVAMAQGNNLSIAREELSEQHRSLVGLAARIVKVGRFQVAWCDLGDLLSQLDMIFIGIEGRGMDQLARLLACGLHNFRVVMAHAGGQNTAKKIKILIAVRIPDIEPLAVIKGQRLCVIENMVGPKILALLV